MKINILAFGQLAEVIGKTEWEMEDVKTTEQLRQTLETKHPEIKTHRYSIAINKNIVHENKTLNQGDVVALLPPFSGG